ncbi:MAG: hypothetical protein LUB59_01270 [Candidatus Gastranaerophilales bacterium]|nr:hypothetical protein [Candidatus Gastranaerophilales bacterium]
MTEYLFDPGYGRHLNSLIYTLEDIYETIGKFKNLSQRKFKFKQYFPAILELLDQNTTFYLGCLLWAVYLKSQPEGDIINNHCLGNVFDEQTSLIELLFLMKFSQTFSKDTKYYLNEDFVYPEEYSGILEIYKEFAILNDGFVNTKKNTDITIPDKLKTPPPEDLETIKRTIDETVSTGDFDKLLKIRGLIL